MEQMGSNILYAKLQLWATEAPDKICLIEAESGAQVTYTQLLQSVTSVRLLLGNDSQIVAVILPSGIANSVLWLACFTGGHTMIPLSPNLTETEYQNAINQHQPDVLVMVTSDKSAGHKIIELAEIAATYQNPSIRVEHNTETKEGSVLLSTSGSTGKPKGIVLSATKCVLTAKYIANSHELTQDDRGLTPLPFYHVNAPIVSLLTTILTGSSLVIAGKYSTSHFWDWVKDYQPTWISLVPTLIAMLMSTDKPDFLDNSSVRYIRTASAQLPEASLKAFEAKFGISLVETYGISEAASTITANPVPPGIHKAASVGLPVGVVLEIHDPATQAVVDQGTVGEVNIKGDNVITQYQDNVAADSFVNGWFRTGDLGYLDADGYVYLTGRIKDIIVRGGENVFPREIEEVMYAFPNVAEAVVVGHPDELYGEKVVAYLTTHDEPKPEFVDDLQTYLQNQLSRYKVPAFIHVLDELPRTAANKINKPLLRTYTDI